MTLIIMETRGDSTSFPALQSSDDRTREVATDAAADANVWKAASSLPAARQPVRCRLIIDNTSK
jgi:hypothetical protein